MSNDFDGPVNSDASAFRNTDYALRYPVLENRVCAICGSGEVWQPLQTMDMPMVNQCLRCGNITPATNSSSWIEKSIQVHSDNK